MKSRSLRQVTFFWTITQVCFFCLKDEEVRSVKDGKVISTPYISFFSWTVDGNRISSEFLGGTVLTVVVDEKIWSMTMAGNLVFEPFLLSIEGDGVSNVWYYEDDGCVLLVVADMENKTTVSYSLERVKDKDGKLTDELTGYFDTYVYERKADGRFEIKASDGTVNHTVFDDKTGVASSDDNGIFSPMPDVVTALFCMLVWAEAGQA